MMFNGQIIKIMDKPAGERPYNKGLISFYEFVKTGFFKVYVNSAIKFHNLSAETKIQLLSENQDKVAMDIAGFIETGVEIETSRFIIKDSISTALNKWDSPVPKKSTDGGTGPGYSAIIP